MRILHRQAGFTISELMISLGLGVALISGAVNIFVQNNRSALQDEQISIMMDNGRFVSRLLSRELAMAGFWGKYLDVATISQHASVSVGTDCGNGIDDWAMELQGLELQPDVSIVDVAANFQCLPALRFVAGSDVLAVKRVADSETADGDVQTGQLYLRTNGAGAQMYLGGGSGTPPVLGGTETNWAYLPSIFYLRDYSVTVGDGLPTLCRAYLNTGATPSMTNQCLVDGIEDLQIELGVDDDRDFIADYYTDSPSTSELTDAVSARIYILARSISEVPNYTNDKTYLLGTRVVAAANDGFYRRVFSTTVVLRNPSNLAGIGT
ncbi:MAG: PilW family protein [Gammaproteobacteria bacterium]|nr:PilW family protein [Pseudomonadales bacterium]MCP5345676.1 PilW family protein [Pseudomonadales bacterium]